MLSFQNEKQKILFIYSKISVCNSFCRKKKKLSPHITKGCDICGKECVCCKGQHDVVKRTIMRLYVEDMSIFDNVN